MPTGPAALPSGLRSDFPGTRRFSAGREIPTRRRRAVTTKSGRHAGADRREGRRVARCFRPATLPGNRRDTGPADGRGRTANDLPASRPGTLWPGRRAFAPSATPAWSTTCYKHVWCRSGERQADPGSASGRGNVMDGPVTPATATGHGPRTVVQCKMESDDRCNCTGMIGMIPARDRVRVSAARPRTSKATLSRKVAHDPERLSEPELRSR